MTVIKDNSSIANCAVAFHKMGGVRRHAAAIILQSRVSTGFLRFPNLRIRTFILRSAHFSEFVFRNMPVRTANQINSPESALLPLI